MTDRERVHVIVGMADRGEGHPPLWIVRSYCPTCAESYYHRTIYG
jgi:hypothetical protein